jgi:uncharacterized protein RhaS with RHS repeats
MPRRGTNHNSFRDYDPTVGRYLQSDPIGNAVTLLNAGTRAIRASQSGNANYVAANSVDRSFAISGSWVLLIYSYDGAGNP